MEIFKFILLIIGSYFVGNILFAKIIATRQNDDITKHGSGNPGASNMVRNHGFILGISTMLLDASKGVISALAGYYLFGGSNGEILAITAMYVGGFFAFIGHILPVFYKFKGGKGVATTFGLFLVADPLITLILFVAGWILFFIVKIASVSTLLFVIAFVIIQTILHANYDYIYVLVVLYLILGIIMYLHRSNLKKLVNGKENKIDLVKTIEKDKEFLNKNKKNNSK
jgi:glycerol-3-phosphate acyltransferase PlsY